MLVKLTNMVRNNKILNISLVYSYHKIKTFYHFNLKIGRKMQHLHHNPQNNHNI